MARPKSPAYFWHAAVSHESDAALEQELRTILQRVASAAAIPTPRLEILDSGQPGAFAFGGWPFASRVLISTGLCSVLTREELTAVLVLRGDAHEIAHLKQGHCLLMACTTIVTLAVLLLLAIPVTLVGYSSGDKADCFLLPLASLQLLQLCSASMPLLNTASSRPIASAALFVAIPNGCSQLYPDWRLDAYR